VHLPLRLSTASVRLLEDGTFLLLPAATDPGESTPTMTAQRVANEVRVGLNDIQIVLPDALLTPMGTDALGK